MATSTTARASTAESPRRRGARALYLAALSWLFAGLSAIRVLTYLPTILAIRDSGESDQHSLLTWCLWLFANVTMALWLYEQNDQHVNGAVIATGANATMCGLTAAVVWTHRF